MQKNLMNGIICLIAIITLFLAGCGDGNTNQNELNKVDQKTVNYAVISDSNVTWYNVSSGSVYGMSQTAGTVTGGRLFYQEANTAWSIVGEGDFDADGLKDLAWWNNETGQVYIMLMSNASAVKSGAIIYSEPNTNWRIVATGDINQDSKSDLIWWNMQTGQVYAMIINGAATTDGAIIYNEPNTNWKIVAAADFVGIGKLGLLWWNSTTGQVYIVQTNGLGTPTGAMIYTEPNTNWRIAGVGDLNGDGKADIVWHNKTTGQVYGMQTNGLSVTNGAMMYTEVNTNWEIVSVTDYNSDNKADLLWWNQQTGQVYLMQMNALTVAYGSIIYTEPNTNWTIQGETEWRDKVYGKGVTTTTRSIPISNFPPVANAGTSLNVVNGTILTLDGGGSSDPDGDRLTYNWVFTSKPVGSIAVLSSTTEQKPTFTADFAGTYIFNLVVNDGYTNSSISTVTITASPSTNLNVSVSGSVLP